MERQKIIESVENNSEGFDKIVWKSAGISRLNKYAAISDLQFISEKFAIPINKATFVSDMYLTLFKLYESERSDVVAKYTKLKQQNPTL